MPYPFARASSVNQPNEGRRQELGLFDLIKHKVNNNLQQQQSAGNRVERSKKKIKWKIWKNEENHQYRTVKCSQRKQFELLFSFQIHNIYNPFSCPSLGESIIEKYKKKQKPKDKPVASRRKLAMRMRTNYEIFIIQIYTNI